MKNILLILLALNISCKGNGQEIKKELKNYQQITKIIENKFPEDADNKFSRIYNTYYTIEKDTVLLIRSEYKNKRTTENDTINDIIRAEKVIKNKTLVLFKDGYIFLFQKNDDKFILVGEIEDEYEIFYDDLGEAHKTYFPTRDIKHYRNDEYIVTYFDEGGFKIGIFEITKKGITKKFLSKGCLFYDEWSEFSFYTIKKDGKLWVNYLIDPEEEEIGQIELKYENGKYSLDKDQCRE